MPFLAQSEALCGGAAAAMVLRYWGDAEVRPVSFASLVDADAGGIATSDLVGELRRRGHEARPFRGAPELVRHHLERGRPVIALVAVEAGRFHYVVIVAWHDDRVLFHDPALGPFRVETAAQLERSWAATDHWALLVLPSTDPPEPSPPLRATADAGPCGGLVDEAVALARADDAEGAGLRLDAAARLCPGQGRVHRERAALRFRAEDWSGAAAEAGVATRLGPDDEHAWRLLATSLYLDGRPEAALVAWNRVGEPEIDAVAFSGLRRNRHDVLLAWSGLPEQGTLRPGALALARRRLAELPAAAAVRAGYTPLGGGRARVEAAVAERPVLAPARALLPRVATDALVERRARLVLHGLARSGDALEIGGRFWSGRPAAWLSAAAPRSLGLPGLVEAELRWERQTYAAAGEDEVMETRRRAGLGVSDWATPHLRWEVGIGADRWSDRGTAASLRLGASLRLAGDRVALRAGGAASAGSDGGFGSWHVGMAARSSASGSRVAARFTASLLGASSEAPRGLWPGAGTGHARPLLLRARPLLEDGVVTGPAFGTRLFHAGVELELELARLGPVRFGVAAFVDHARARPRPGAEWGPGLSDAGGGLRLRLPGGQALRVDLATPLDGDGVTLSAGWLLPWG